MAESKTDKNGFIIGKPAGLLNSTQIITDTMTGVQYLFAFNGSAGGLTLWWTRTASL